MFKYKIEHVRSPQIKHKLNIISRMSYQDINDKLSRYRVQI